MRRHRGAGATPLNTTRGFADVISVTRALVVALFGIVCMSWLSLAALHTVALKRAGSVWSPDTRLWVRLKITEYGLLLLLVIAAVVGVPKWSLLVMALLLVVLALVRRRIRRRAVEWPPQWVERS